MMNGTGKERESILNSIRATLMLAGLIAALVLAGCEQESTVTQLTEVQGNEPDQEFIDSRIVITEQGRTNAIVQAESISVFQNQNFTTFDGGITIEFFDDRGELTSSLKAGHGEVWGLYEDVDSLRARDNVEVVSADGAKRMNTDSSLSWSAQSRKIFADGLVTLTTSNAVEQGVNFVAKDDLSEYTMENVSGVYQGQDLPSFSK